MIELRGTYRIDDLARHFYFDALRKSWWFIVSIPAGLILIALLITFITIQNPGIQWHGFQNVIPFGLLLLVWLFLMAVMPYRTARKEYATKIYLREYVTYVFTPETINTSGTGISSSVSWKNITRFRETKSLFLLYLGPNGAINIPKRFFQSPEEMERWRQLVQSSMDPKLIEKPSFVGRWC
jgi:hypothetical protein